MRSKFPGYYPPSDPAFFEGLWNDATFVLDANILLSFFRYSSETRKSLHAFLDANKARLWLPHHAAAEYHRNLHQVRYEPVRALENTIRHLKETKDKTREDDHRKRFEKLLAQAEEFKKEATSKLDDEQEWVGLIADLFDGRVGDPWSEVELAKVLKEGEERKRKKIPPGLRDSSKGGDDQYGDFVIWKQLLDYAKATKSSAIVFVTDDNKDDWWHTIAGERLGPRPELLGEMRQCAPACRFYMYSGDSFLEFANASLGAKVTAEAIAEVRKTQHQHEVDLEKAREALRRLVEISRTWLGPQEGRDRFAAGYTAGLAAADAFTPTGLDIPDGSVWAGRYYQAELPDDTPGDDDG